MKYKELYLVREELKGIVSKYNMSPWEIKTAKKNSKEKSVPLVDSYLWVIKMREFMGALHDEASK